MIIRYVYYTEYSIPLGYGWLALLVLTELAMLSVTVLC